MFLVDYGFIVLNIVIVVLIYKSISDYNVSQEMEHQVQILSSNDALLQSQKNKADDFRAVIKQDVERMKNATQTGDIEALKERYGKALNHLSYHEDERELSVLGLKGIHSNALKGLIISKMIHAQNLGVSFELGVIGTLTHIPINAIDLCRMVGILLDNAIEAACESEKKEVHLIISKGLETDADLWQVKIRNTHNGKINNFSTAMQSTKGEGRGMGMKSLRAMVSKYSQVRLVTDYSKAYIDVALAFHINQSAYTEEHLYA